jgi:hypothetical protein
MGELVAEPGVAFGAEGGVEVGVEGAFEFVGVDDFLRLVDVFICIGEEGFAEGAVFGEGPAVLLDAATEMGGEFVFGGVFHVVGEFDGGVLGAVGDDFLDEEAANGAAAGDGDGARARGRAGFHRRLCGGWAMMAERALERV